MLYSTANFVYENAYYRVCIVVSNVLSAADFQSRELKPAAKKSKDGENSMNSGDTAWVLVSTALVTIMMPALAFFYGGMVRRKNILSTLNLTIISMALLGVTWVMFGYSMAFSENGNAFIGGLDKAFMLGVTPDSLSGTIPEYVFAAFQGTFAMITPALITGAFVERIRFKSYILFILLWSILVYNPVAHWVWGPDGFLGHGAGVLDFAGGAVVHITAGLSALVFALLIRRRQGFKDDIITPHNIPYTVLGAGLLWAGWFGFNGGSALAADGVAAMAIVNTNTAAAAAALVWMLLSWLDDGKPSVLGIVTGAVVGLVAITPAAGFVEPWAALVMGALAAPISYYAIRTIHGMGIDESLDVFACHGMAGLFGALATGIFAIDSGLVYGHGIGQFITQLWSVVVVGLYAMALTFIICKLLDATIGLAVNDKEEQIGLDVSDHRERAYS